MKNPWVILTVITVVLFGGAIVYSKTANEKNNQGVTVTDHVKGNLEATVTLTEYSDFQCPACASFQPVVAELMAQYGDKLRFEYKHFPLPIHNFAQQAAVAAEAASQQGKFFEFHDTLFSKQQEWSTSATPQVFFVQYAKELGLDVEKFKAHQNSSVLRDAVRASSNEARELGLTGTPTFFLNGERMQFETFEDFLRQIATAVDPTGASLGTTSASLAEPAVKFGL
ncbi:MAG: thioredoxin domain-containing protein [Patescibacteria group bacterium]